MSQPVNLRYCGSIRQASAVCFVPVHRWKTIADLAKFPGMYCYTATAFCSGRSNGRRLEFMTGLFMWNTVSKTDNLEILEPMFVVYEYPVTWAGGVK